MEIKIGEIFGFTDASNPITSKRTKSSIFSCSLLLLIDLALMKDVSKSMNKIDFKIDGLKVYFVSHTLFNHCTLDSLI